MSYSPQIFPFLCTLEPLRNPKWGLGIVPFSMCCTRQGYSQEWTLLPHPESPAQHSCPADPYGGHHTLGRGEEARKRGDVGGEHPLVPYLDNY